MTLTLMPHQSGFLSVSLRFELTILIAELLNHVTPLTALLPLQGKLPQIT